MATIIDKPDALSLSGNMRRFTVEATAAVSLVLARGTDLLLARSYEPGADKRVTIDVSEVVDSQLSYTLDTGRDSYPQDTIAGDFTAIINGESHAFRAIRAGVANLADTPGNWLKSHFLTWQPRVKDVTYHSPEWLTYYAVSACSVKARATFPDKSSHVLTLREMAAGECATLNLQYATVSRLLGNRDPTHYEVWAEAGGGKLTGSQLYRLSDRLSEDEQWFLFENSLGGLDTFRAYGVNNLEAGHTHQVAETGASLVEYDVETERKFTKNTGHLDAYARRWLLDFFPSRAKYIYEASAIRRIVVTESDVSYASSDLPSSYTFTYRMADTSRFLNLVRDEGGLPGNLVVPDTGKPDFIFPPRLAELPRLELNEGVLIPVFDPLSPTSTVTTLGQLKSAIGIEGGGSGENPGGPIPEIIGAADNETPPTDKNLYSAARSKKEDDKIRQEAAERFLDKLTAARQSVAGEVSFESGLKALESLSIGDFIRSMIAGQGAGSDKHGNMQMESLEVRSYMKVMELIFNRLSAMEGDYSFTESGTVEAVERIAEDTYVLTLRRRWDLDITAFGENDILYGVVNNLLTSGEYYTSWVRVIHKDSSANQITVVVYPDSEVPAKRNFAPVKSMNLTRRGNALDKQRQDAWYISSYEGCIMYLQGVTKPILEERNYSLTIGKPKNLELFNGLPINYDHPYLFARGAIIQDLFRVDYKGQPVVSIVDRGVWSLETATTEPYRSLPTEAHEVWHRSCKYRCIVDETKEEPRWNATGWVLVSGDTSLRLELDSSNGTSFMANQVDTVITAQVYRGVNDITPDIMDTDWEWTRETDDPVSDALWNGEHASSTTSIHLTDTDLGLNILTTRQCKFTCVAYVRDNDNKRMGQTSKSFDI